MVRGVQPDNLSLFSRVFHDLLRTWIQPGELSRFDGGVIRGGTAEVLRQDVRIAQSAELRLIKSPQSDG